MAGIYFHWAPDNIVQNNTLYGNKVAQVWFSGRYQPGEKLVDEVVLDNIMFATDAQQKTFYLGIKYDDVHFGQSDRNYFYNPYRTSHIFLSLYSGGSVRTPLTIWCSHNKYMVCHRERKKCAYQCIIKRFFLTGRQLIW
jgi:hypothetical protein